MNAKKIIGFLVALSLLIWQSVSAQSTCGDMGAENGWGAWQAATGVYSGGTIVFNATNIAPAAPRFNLTSGAGIDGCSPGPTPGDPILPLVAPGFGNASIQLGNPRANGYDDGCSPPYPTMAGGCVEQLTYSLNVTPQDTNFMYAYAIVLENPINVPHTHNDVPFAEIYILDQNGDTIQCSHHKYTGSVNATGVIPPGMFAASCPGPVVANYGPNGMDVAYKPWSVNGISLKNYVGQTIKIVLTNVDCGRSGHFCHSYWDFQCQQVGISSPFCLGQSTTLSGPSPDPTNPYTYQWYQNGQQYTGLPSGTSQSITPTPQAGDTFAVQVQQPSGCNFWMTFVPQPTTIIPDFTFSGNCGSMSFIDASSVAPVSASNSVVAWNWQFPGGTPSNSALQNPGTIIYPPGTYTVILVVTSTAGCKDTIQHSFTVVGLSAVMNQTNSLCTGSGSASVTVSGGNPGYAYAWSNGATTSYISNLVAGNYSITVTDAAGCTVSNTVAITSSGSVVATAMNSTICAGQNAILTASGGGNYSWSNGATTSSIHISPAYTSTYSVIVSIGSCTDTAFAMVTVNPSPAVSIGNDQTLCTAQNLTLDAQNPGASYLWSNGATTQTINVSGAGTYWVIVAMNNCLAKDTVKTFITPSVQLFDSSLCTMSPIILNAGSGATSYLWSDGSTSQTMSVDVSGNYWVEVMFGNCKTSDTAKISGEQGEGSLYVPNAFTPNDDNLNEIFLAKGTGITSFDMKVFDRWGNLIFTSGDVNNGWDGRIQGGNYILKGDGEVPAQEDVYVWKINYTTQCFPGRVEKEIGHVTIVK